MTLTGIESTIRAIDEILEGIPVIEHVPTEASTVARTHSEATTVTQGLFHLRSRRTHHLAIMFDGNGMEVAS